MAPPDLDMLATRLGAHSDRMLQLILRAASRSSSIEPYHPWDKLRHRQPPDDMTAEEWWFVTKVARRSVQRELALHDERGLPFTYALTDNILRSIEEVNRRLSGTIGIGERVANAANRNSYLISSLMEEAITSSQLEGAATTRAVAKEMLRTGRAPANRDERMIRNNYAAMLRVGDFRDELITPDRICEIQRIVTEGTLRDPAAAGRFQQPGEQRVAVCDEFGSVLYAPPPAEQIAPLVDQLCDFVNTPPDSGAYLPPVIRAIAAHFMIGYVHPFEDGNGRTARALFYWLMLREDYWLTEFIPISRILRKAPVQYAYSYLYTEQDDNDLTYFVIHQLNVIATAIRDLQEYFTQKIREAREFQRTIATLPGELNPRQHALLQNALADPRTEYTVRGHADFHRVVRQTARDDLSALESLGYLVKDATGRRHTWHPAPYLSATLASVDREPTGRRRSR